LADPLLSRFAPRARFVALRQTFVRHSHRGWTAAWLGQRGRGKGVSIAAAFRPYVWRWRRIAPVHEGPRSESSNNAHEPTSGRSTHYGSGHL